MRGDIVIIRVFGNEPAIRRVWEVDLLGVYVTTENYFHRLVAGKDGFISVMFPWGDVYECNPEMVELIDKYREEFTWGQLKQYKPKDVSGKAS